MSRMTRYVMRYLNLGEIDVARRVAMVDGIERRELWSYIPERLPIGNCSGRTANGRLDRTVVEKFSRAFMCSSKGRSNKIEVGSRGTFSRQRRREGHRGPWILTCVLYT
jgi:hypothetical protein